MSTVSNNAAIRFRSSAIWLSLLLLLNGAMLTTCQGRTKISVKACRVTIGHIVSTDLGNQIAEGYHSIVGQYGELLEDGSTYSMQFTVRQSKTFLGEPEQTFDCTAYFARNSEGRWILTRIESGAWYWTYEVPVEDD